MKDTAKINMEIFRKLQKNSGIRYLIVGGASFVLEYSSFMLLYRIFAVQLYVANSTSFGIGLLTSFLLNRLWTFGSETYSRKGHHQFAMYLSLAVLNLFITNVMIGVLFKYFGVSPTFGKIAAIFFIVIWNFLIFKHIIFTKSTNKKIQSTL